MCGVTGILHSNLSSNDSTLVDATYDVYRSLLKLQHRGQDAAGIVSYSSGDRKFYAHRELGLISKVFNQDILSSMKSNMAIGHTRYATTGGDKLNDLQPLLTGFPVGLSIAHNGNVLNYHELTRDFGASNLSHLLTSNDLEIFQNIWCRSFSLYKENFLGALFHGAEEIIKNVVGAYAIVGLVADKGLFAFRDPNGIRPLSIGQRNENGVLSWTICSETSSMNQLGYSFVRDVLPGEVVFIDKEGEIYSRVINHNENFSPCMFEWVYFSGAEASISERDVYSVRLELGRGLAKQISKQMESKKINFDIVCPVPDTSRTAAISLAEELGIPYREGLIKNRYSQRSFILKNDQERERAVELKLTPIISEIQNKDILLVDDSIVRGTTSLRIISLLKKYGAKSVTMAVTCPPIRSGCFYGVDFPDEKTLIAGKKNVDEIASDIGANHIEFLSEENLLESIGIKSACMACINGKYPTSTCGSEEFSTRRNELRV